MTAADLGSAQTERALRTLEGASARLLSSLEARTHLLHAPSRLPRWSRANVVAHLTYGAVASARMTREALAGEATAFYPGGRSQRSASIAVADALPGHELLERLRRACDDLRQLWAVLPQEVWSTEMTETSLGAMALSRLVALRLTEVEVHHADLGLGCRSADWDHEFVATCLPLRIAWLPVHHRRRPDADREINGRWLLHEVERGHMWVVSADGDHAEVHESKDAPDGPHVVFRGSGRDLLAFLLGRAAARVGDMSECRAFKQAFPGP